MARSQTVIHRTLYTTNEAVAILGITRRTLERYVKAKRIQPVRLPSGRGVRTIPRYTKESLDALVESGTRS